MHDQKVTKKSPEPDWAILTFRLEARDFDYERSLLELDRRVELLRRELERADVDLMNLVQTVGWASFLFSGRISQVFPELYRREFKIASRVLKGLILCPA